jgi:predicted dienelactone hydrolase
MRSFMFSVVVVAVVACQPSSTSVPVTHVEPTPAGPSAVGFHTFDVVDPISHAAMPAAVFYPATGPEAHTDVGPYALAAGADLPMRDGRHPLVVISHGHGGALWGHHDLAAALARHGYVVAAVEHAGDNYHDQSRFRSDVVLFGRAYQISAMIDAVLADPARIGVTGFSAGGWTSLLIVGARPDFALVTTYCERHHDDNTICAGPLLHELDHPKPTVDHRVKAAFVMAPFAIPFGDGAFADVTAPIFLYWGEADPLLLPAENAQLVLRAPTLKDKHSIPKAGHFVFIPPCSPTLAKVAAEICTDPPGVDRAKIHDQINADAVRFFDATL